MGSFARFGRCRGDPMWSPPAAPRFIPAWHGVHRPIPRPLGVTLGSSSPATIARMEGAHAGAPLRTCNGLPAGHGVLRSISEQGDAQRRRCVRSSPRTAPEGRGSGDRDRRRPRGRHSPLGMGSIVRILGRTHTLTARRACAAPVSRARWRPQAGGRSADGRGPSGGYGPPPASPCRRRRRRRRPARRRSPAASPAAPP